MTLPARKVAAPPLPPVAADTRRHRIHIAVGRCANPVSLTDAERRSIWEAACATLAAELELGEPPHMARRAVLDHLWRHAPGLAASQAALRVAFVRKFARLRDGGLKGVAAELRRRFPERVATAAMQRLGIKRGQTCHAPMVKQIREGLARDVLGARNSRCGVRRGASRPKSCMMTWTVNWQPPAEGKRRLTPSHIRPTPSLSGVARRRTKG